MMAISEISADDLARWQRIFKRDQKRRYYNFFLGKLDAVDGDRQRAALALIEAVATVGGDADACQRMMHQTRISGLDAEWLRARVVSAVNRKRGG